ncbi:hypothetical protein [Ascidiimonas aurantiaca]|uniref:hypothetical protein n=1 Tax=Ascidiimonas aurantiaca TaxID=1685432 RepID=UPI0030EE6C1A
MKKLLLKSALYAILLLLMLEVWVRIFHLSKDNPVRFIDEKKVEKWMPDQQGHSVTGNRRQNFSEYSINRSGFNSYREFSPTKEKVEIALVGDSFIEGFHQNYYNSTGKKIENKLLGIEVYEYGYAGYDMADQLHLIHAYKDKFDLIDYVILGIKFSNDLGRGSYYNVASRMKFEQPFYRIIRKSKLLVYTQNIGGLDPVRDLATRIFSVGKTKTSEKKEPTPEEIRQQDEEYLKNLKSLMNEFGFDKERFVFLLDSRATSRIFIDFLHESNIKYIDFADEFAKAKRSTDLIYDKHWNNYGRELIARVITSYIKEQEEIKNRN